MWGVRLVVGFGREVVRAAQLLLLRFFIVNLDLTAPFDRTGWGLFPWHGLGLFLHGGWLGLRPSSIVA